MTATLPPALPGALTLHGVPVALRIVPVFAVLVTIPGLALARLVPQRRAERSLVVPAALGIAWLVLATEALLYAGWWKPAALVPMAALTVVASLRIRTRPRGRRTLRTRSDAPLVAAVGFAMVGSAVWAMLRMPFTARELADLQAAWLRSRGGAAHGPRATSLTALVDSWLIPFERAGTGTLFAARWLGLVATVLAVLGLSGAMHNRVRLDRRALTSLAVLALALVAQHGRFDDATTMAAPLLFGGLWLLDAPRATPWSRVAGGAMLALAGLGSIQAAAVAAVWFADGEWRRHESGRPDAASSNRFAAVGALVSLGGALLFARGFDVVPPVFAATLRFASFAGEGNDDAVLVASLNLAALALLAVWILLRTLRRSGPGSRMSAEMPRLAASLAALALVSGPAVQSLLVPTLLGGLLASTALAPAAASDDARRDARRDGDELVHEQPPRRAIVRTGAVAAIALSMAVGAVAAGPANVGQMAKLADVYRLTGAGQYVAVADRAEVALRRTVPLSQLERAAVVVVDPRRLEQDGELRTRLERSFRSTATPGVWQRIVRYSAGF